MLSVELSTGAGGGDDDGGAGGDDCGGISGKRRGGKGKRASSAILDSEDGIYGDMGGGRGNGMALRRWLLGKRAPLRLLDPEFSNVRG